MLLFKSPPPTPAAFLISQQLLSACLSPCGSGAGGGGAGREYELPGWQAGRKEGKQAGGVLLGRLLSAQ